MSRSTLAPLALAALLAACDDHVTDAPNPLADPGGAAPRAALATGGATPYWYQCAQSLVSSQAAANEQVRAKYETWLASRVAWSGAQARVVADSGFTWSDGSGSHPLPYGTISEGHAYGMLLAAYMGDKKTFDALEAYRVAHRNANGLMPWVIDQNGVVADSGAASDADEDIAFALLLADQRWGGYWTPMNSVLTAIKTHMVYPAGSAYPYLLKSGDDGWWDDIHPGYMAPAWYKAFATYTGDAFWTSVTNRSYQYLADIDANAAYANASTGLLPDRTADGSGTVDPDTAARWFSWNAIRAPWRLAADAAWNCDTRASGRVNKMNAFFSGSGPGQGYMQIGSVYTTGGSFLDDDLYGGTDRQPWFYGPLTSAALLSSNGTYKQGMWDQTMGMTDFSAYGHELGLLGLLLASGNMYDPLAGQPRRALDEFESGTHTRWWTYVDGSGSTLSKSMVWPAAVGHGMKVTHAVAGWAGIGTTVNENWGGYRAIEYWIKGTGANNTVYVEIEDADGERFRHSFVNDFTGWKFASVPLDTSGFPRRTDWQPVATNNGMTLSNVQSFRFEPTGSASFEVDRIVLVP